MLSCCFLDFPVGGVGLLSYDWVRSIPFSLITTNITFTGAKYFIN